MYILVGIVIFCCLFSLVGYTYNKEQRRGVPSEESGYVNLVLHILLLPFSFGIWLLIWIYRTTMYTNRVISEESRSGVLKLLLCVFIPFYWIYWTYITAKRIDQMSAAKMISSNIAIPCTVLAVFLPFISFDVMQYKINKIARENNSVVIVQAANISRNSSIAEELQKFKELLDSGAITPEEYDIKKEQLLNQ